MSRGNWEWNLTARTRVAVVPDPAYGCSAKGR